MRILKKNKEKTKLSFHFSKKFNLQDAIPGNKQNKSLIFADKIFCVANVILLVAYICLYSRFQRSSEYLRGGEVKRREK